MVRIGTMQRRTQWLNLHRLEMEVLLSARNGCELIGWLGSNPFLRHKRHEFCAKVWLKIIRKSYTKALCYRLLHYLRV